MLVEIPGDALIDWPPPNTQNFGISVVGGKNAHHFVAPKTGTIDAVLFRTWNVSGTGLSCSARLETVDTTTGYPTGTVLGTPLIFTPVSNTTYTLSAQGVAALEGDRFALVIEVTAGTTPSVTILGTSGTNVPVGAPSYNTGFNGTAWVTSSNGYANILVRYADGTTPRLQGAYPALGVNGFVDSASPKLTGNRIVLPFACRVSGIYFIGNNSSNAPYRGAIYDASGAVLASRGVTSPEIMSEGLANCYFATPVDLAPGTYRFVFAATSTNVRTYYWAVPLAQDLGAYPWGANVYWTESADGGTTWTDIPTRRHRSGIWLSALSDNAGAGNVIVIED